MTEPRRAYLIVGNPRTGSSVLARALTETGRMGRPEEYFWRWQEKQWASHFGLPVPEESNYAAYMRAALQYGTTSNGVFAAKVFWAHAEDLIRRTADIPHLASLPGHQRFRRVFADDLRAVFLRRNCLRAAAVGIDLDAVRARTESSSGPEALTQAVRRSLARPGSKGGASALVLLRRAHPDIFDDALRTVINKAKQRNAAEAG